MVIRSSRTTSAANRREKSRSSEKESAGTVGSDGRVAESRYSGLRASALAVIRFPDAEPLGARGCECRRTKPFPAKFAATRHSRQEFTIGVQLRGVIESTATKPAAAESSSGEVRRGSPSHGAFSDDTLRGLTAFARTTRRRTRNEKKPELNKRKAATVERSSRRKVTHTWSKKRPRTPYVLVGEAIATTVRPHLTLVRTPPWRMEGAQPRQSAHARPCLKHLLLLLTAVAPGKKKRRKRDRSRNNKQKQKKKERKPCRDYAAGRPLRIAQTKTAGTTWNGRSDWLATCLSACPS